MIKLFISPAANEDLMTIWHYVGVENANPDAASSIISSIRDTLLLLPKFPELGRACPEFFKYVDDNLRCVHIEGYTVYYRFIDGVIQVGRVVHARQDREEIIRSWFCSELDN